MIRTFVVAACFACLGATAAVAQAAPATTASPACVYENKSYSDGALICIYRSLMLSCSQDSGKASWKPVTDTRLTSVCESSSAPPRPRVVEAPRRPRHRHYVSRPPVRYQADRSSKCFVFNGKQYCE
jgi:hypothetical protein